MKYMKRKKIYQNYNNTNTFDPETFEAVSYGWWTYVKDFDGVKVFNTFRYSPTTGKHQRHLRGLLQDLEMKMGFRSEAIWQVECPKGLQSIEGLDSGIELYSQRIRDLIKLINKKGTRKSKNEERIALINQYKTKIEMIQRLKKSLESKVV